MSQNKTRLTWLWIGASGAGALVGAAIALFLFPIAAFATNPTGKFGWHLVGFAFSLGIPFALAQYAVLRIAVPDRPQIQASVLALWIPVTSIGLAAMIFPFWWWDAMLFIYMPFMVAVPILPGSFLLAFGQWSILNHQGLAGLSWLALTLLGAVLGVFIGFLVAFEFALPVELPWALVTGLFIGSLQAIGLQDVMSNPGSD